MPGSSRRSVPIGLVTRFIGTSSCAPFIELTASTRLKVEIVSGEAKIWLQGGDISKARKMVEEVIQKETHGEWNPNTTGAEEGSQTSLIESAQQAPKVKSPRDDRVRLSGSRSLTSANVLRVLRRHRQTRTASAVTGTPAVDPTTRPTRRSRLVRRASRQRNHTTEKRSRGDFAEPPTRAWRSASSASRQTTPSERLCKIAVPWRVCKIGWKARGKSRLVDSDSREIDATVEERY